MSRLPTPDLDHALEHVGDAWQALAGARLFITGGTGFVGKWLIESLLWASDRLNLGVSATVLTRNPDRFRAQSPQLAGHPALALLKGDVQSFDFPAGEFPFVIHAATERYFEPDVARPLSTFDLDLEGTRRVLEFARAHGARRLLFTSSGAVYGKQPPDLTHIPEDYAGAPLTTDTGSAYGQAKRASEFLCAMYARQYGFAALIARMFAFVGPHLPRPTDFIQRAKRPSAIRCVEASLVGACRIADKRIPPSRPFSALPRKCGEAEPACRKLRTDAHRQRRSGVQGRR
jgi:dTDP-glucose 4,6-dehydratase